MLDVFSPVLQLRGNRDDGCYERAMWSHGKSWHSRAASSRGTMDMIHLFYIALNKSFFSFFLFFLSFLLSLQPSNLRKHLSRNVQSFTFVWSLQISQKKISQKRMCVWIFFQLSCAALLKMWSIDPWGDPLWSL